MQTLTLSASSINTFQGCRKRYEYEKIMHIYPVERNKALGYGTAVHKGLEQLFSAIQIQSNFNPGRDNENVDLDEWKRFVTDAAMVTCAKEGLSIEDELKVVASLNAYIDNYLIDDLENMQVMDVEREFLEPIINPANGRKCNSIRMNGFADGIVRNLKDGKLYILEHKTSGMVNDGYMDKILIDWQIAIYAHFISRKLNEPIVGAIYDIIKKPAIRMSAGTAKKPPETPDEFAKRLAEYMTPDFFIRKTIMFDDALMVNFLSDLWAVSKEISKCKVFYKCTGNCLKYGACPHLALCRANGDLEAVKDLYYVGKTNNEPGNEED